MSNGLNEPVELPYDDLLSAPATTAAAVVPPGDGQVVELNPLLCDIYAGNGRAQTKFDHRRNAALLADIKANGQQTPVLARRVGDRYQVIAGSRRLGAVLALRGETPAVTIKAVLLEVTDEQAWQMADKENANRRDLTPIQRARSWEYAIEAFHGGRQDMFATAIGEDRSVVSRTLALLKIPEVVLGALKDPEGVSVHFAAQLAPQLQDEDQVARICASARNLIGEGVLLSAPELLDVLLSTPQQLAERQDVAIELEGSAKHAVFKRKRDGTASLSLKAIDLALHDIKARKAFLASIDQELRRFLSLAPAGRVPRNNVGSTPQSVEGLGELDPAAA